MLVLLREHMILIQREQELKFLTSNRGIDYEKVYSKPVVVVDTFLNNDATNALNFISTTIAPKSANLSSKFTKLNQ